MRSPWDGNRSAVVLSPAAAHHWAASPLHALPAGSAEQGFFASPVSTSPRDQHKVAQSIALSVDVHHQPILSPPVRPQPTADRQINWASPSLAQAQHPTQGTASFARQESGGDGMRAQPSWYVAGETLCEVTISTSLV